MKKYSTPVVQPAYTIRSRVSHMVSYECVPASEGEIQREINKKGRMKDGKEETDGE